MESNGAIVRGGMLKGQSICKKSAQMPGTSCLQCFAGFKRNASKTSSGKGRRSNRGGPAQAPQPAKVRKHSGHESSMRSIADAKFAASLFDNLG